MQNSWVPALMRSRLASFMSNERQRHAGLTARLFDPDGGRVRVACGNGDHAVDGLVFQQFGLDRLGHGRCVAERRGRQRQLGRRPAAGNHAVHHALAARFGVGGARQGVDAQHVLLAMAGEIFATRHASQIFIVADIVDRAQFRGLVSAACVHQDHGDASGNRVLDRRIFSFGHPVRDDQTVNFHRDRGADQLHHIGGEVVIVHQAQIVDRTAIGDDGRASRRRCPS